MALSAAFLSTSASWQLSYAAAAGLPALNLLQAGLNCRTWSSSTAPISNNYHQVTATQANLCAPIPTSSPAAQPSSAAVAAAVSNALRATRGLRVEKPGQSYRFFSNSSFAASGLRTFTATPLPHDEEEHTHEDVPLLGGSRHRAANRSHKHRVQHALHILQHGNVLNLRDMLSIKAESAFHITYEELIQMSKESGAAHTDQEAEELAEALSRAGVVLRYRSIIYLRPQEVADIIIKALPDSEQEAQQKVEEIDAELQSMKGKIDHVEQIADRWARVWLWGGCGLLAFQLAAFIRLIWWELSWDVMEPFAYVLGLGNTLIGYIYFMTFRNNLDYKPFQDYWKGSKKNQAALEHQVDLVRYEELTKLRARYVQHMKAISSDMRPLPSPAKH